MPRKLGQHFLKNESAIKKIIATLELKNGETVLEIGAGHGELTKPLLEVCGKVGCKVMAVEKDPELAAGIQNLENSENLKVITGDIRKILPKLVSHYSLCLYGTSPEGRQTTHYKLVGNIPFYITGRLLRNISELKNKPELCVLTLQKEVAERICVAPPKMNRLAAVVQFWAEPKIIGFISKKDFSPPPEVDSAIIRLGVRLEVLGFRGEKQKLSEENYYRMVRILFQQPRKTVANNLTSGLKTDRLEIAKKLEKLSIFPNLRPQNLSVEEIIKISKEIKIYN